jgi:hypothetical protein
MTRVLNGHFSSSCGPKNIYLGYATRLPWGDCLPVSHMPHGY